MALGVFALDPLGRIVFSNPAGKKLLGDGLDIVNEKLLVGPTAERGALEAVVLGMIKGGPEDLLAEPKPILIHRREVTSTTLADLLMPLLAANPFLTMRASLRRWSSDEFENGVTHGRQGWLGRRPIDSFFSASLF